MLAGNVGDKKPRAARYFVTKLNPDGSVDKGFANNGLRVDGFLNTGSSQGVVVDMALDGSRIVVGGWSYGKGRHPTDCVPFKDCHAEFAIARYRASGKLDQSFGSGGRLHIPVKHKGKRVNAYPDSLAVDSKGRYLLSGLLSKKPTHGSPFNPTAMTLVRVTHGGKPDPSFGNRGQVKLKILGSPPEHDESHDVIADARDLPLVVGRAEDKTAHPRKYRAFALRFKG